jgi:adenosylhomocysteine nucleosidase
LSARSIIVAGFGGALERSLAVADVVIDGWPAFDGERWLRFGAIHTADQLAATREQKADLFGQTGALAVDMETAIVRRAAAGVGVPVIAVRAITDTAAHEIDPAMLGLLDDAGRVRGLELMRLLLLRKKTLSQLFRLRAAASIAGARLAQALGLLLDSVQGK